MKRAWRRLCAWLFVFTNSWSEATIDEFTGRFPDRCMVCSLHLWGMRHGHVGPKDLPRHWCCERQDEIGEAP
jgi:hypothetical protein